MRLNVPRYRINELILTQNLLNGWRSWESRCCERLPDRAFEAGNLSKARYISQTTCPLCWGHPRRLRELSPLVPPGRLEADLIGKVQVQLICLERRIVDYRITPKLVAGEHKTSWQVGALAEHGTCCGRQKLPIDTWKSRRRYKTIRIKAYINARGQIRFRAVTRMRINPKFYVRPKGQLR